MSQWQHGKEPGNARLFLILHRPYLAQPWITPCAASTT
jgi:hypothetical protein